MIGAEIGVTSDAQASWWGGRGVGTVPHALIAAYGGNTVLAATKFAEWATENMNIVVLVDFDNDSVRTALDVARALGPRLWGVRLDTSGQLVDRSLWGEMGDFDPRGVNERLVRKVRDALDADGFERVRIVGVRRIHGGQDRGLRAERRPGRRLRDRLLADPRPERLHRRHRPHRRPALRKGRPQVPPERAARTRRLEVSRPFADDAGPLLASARPSGRRALPTPRSARTRRLPRRCSRPSPERRRARCSPRAGRPSPRGRAARSGRRADRRSSRRRNGSSPGRRSRRRRIEAAPRAAAGYAGRAARPRGRPLPPGRASNSARSAGCRLSAGSRPASSGRSRGRRAPLRPPRPARTRCRPGSHGTARREAYLPPSSSVCV